jgi:hypothetical protein
VNAHLDEKHRVAVMKREINYLLDVPYFYLNSLIDMRIDTRLGPENLEKLWGQLWAQKVTHLLVDRSIVDPGSTGIGASLHALQQLGCVAELAAFPAQNIISRTLSGGAGLPIIASALEMTPATCAASFDSGRRGR